MMDNRLQVLTCRPISRVALHSRKGLITHVQASFFLLQALLINISPFECHAPKDPNTENNLGGFSLAKPECVATNQIKKLDSFSGKLLVLLS